MFYDFFDTGLIGTLTLVGDDQGLRHINFETEKRPLAIQPDWHREPAYFAAAKDQLSAYFAGQRKTFDLPLAPRGTPFQLRVWDVLKTIPFGTVTSYAWVARQAGNLKAVRAVGGANARNPLPLVIPCHRVIGSNGALTGFGGGLSVKQRLIDLEQASR
jgi:methylated-DNA-[protein]-cysteine S-methyltransferase